jgi:arylsulfatase A-like enzyme
MASFWLVRGITRGARRLAASWPRPARIVFFAAFFVLVDAAGLLYLSSWALYLRTGSFASIEAFRYAFVDYPGMTWFYVMRSEPWSLAAFAVLAVSAGLGIPLLFWSAAGKESRAGSFPRTALLLILLLAVCSFLLALSVARDRSEIRQASRIRSLEFGLNPWVAVSASWLESAGGEKIEPVLNVQELRPLSAAWKAPKESPRPSIVFVKIESIRFDVLRTWYQGTEIVPNLNALTRMGVELTRAYSATTHTDYSDVSTLSSLYPLRTRQHHYYRKNDPWPKTLIYDLLEPQGYATAIVAAENLAWGKMDRFLQTPHLDFLFDAERSGTAGRIDRTDDGIAGEVREGVLSAGVIEDEQTTDVALRWIAAPLASRRPFFLNLDLQSSHFPYELPAKASRPFQPSTIDFDVSFVRYPYKKTDIVRNAYYNALHEADRQLGRIVSALRAADALEDTILVVYGDHGEAFRENGHVTHAAQPIEVVVRVPCIIVAPRYLKPGKDDYPAELIDLPPTVLSLLGWPRHPNFQGIDLFAPDRPPLGRRALFMHTENPLSHTDAVILAGRWKHTLDRDQRRERLYDLLVDPGEARDISGNEPVIARNLGRLLALWRSRQLAYYHYPIYFENYYPPPPPIP